MLGDYNVYLKSLKQYYQKCEKLSQNFIDSFHASASILIELSITMQKVSNLERRYATQPIFSLGTNLKQFATCLSQIVNAIGNSFFECNESDRRNPKNVKKYHRL